MAVSTIDNGVVRVSLNSLGAELSSIIDQNGNELLWQGGEVWPRRAPVLFPIVGRMPNDELIHDGGSYPISQHGFARDQNFRVARENPTEVQFSLVDNAATLMRFPFPFRLDILFSLEGSRLGVTTSVANTGSERFSASLGEHPGFAWPLLPGIPKDSHVLEFATDEPAPIRRLADGFVLPDPQPSPVVGRTIALDESLFAADAMIFDSLTSRSVRYSAPGAPSITVDFADFPLLGVWSKAPGEFLCIEPWFGMTAPVGFSGEYDQKPGQFSLAPGDVVSFAYGITAGTA